MLIYEAAIAVHELYIQVMAFFKRLYILYITQTSSFILISLNIIVMQYYSEQAGLKFNTSGCTNYQHEEFKFVSAVFYPKLITL